MPRTKLGDKYSRPKKLKVNELAALLKTYKKDKGVTNDNLARKFGVSKQTVMRTINQPVRKWTVDNIALYASALNIPFDEVFEKVKESL